MIDASDTSASDAGAVCCDDAWEAAYLRFETPEQEIRKFTRRLVESGCRGWDADARIVELFCGRGSGLTALSRLGFDRIEGVDLSPTLVACNTSPATCHVADCRDLPFESASRDILVVQGGLHHLPVLPDDLDRTLDEMVRVLVPDGRVVIVEPWRTLFLDLAHAACGSRLLRRLWGRLDALAVMIEHERTTYEAWLGCPDRILDALRRRFTPDRLTMTWGKLMFVGRPGNRRS